MATVIIALWEGVMPVSTLLFNPEYAYIGTRPLGYPDYFAQALIVAKALSVVAICYPGTPGRLREWAYAGLSFTLIFAFISHACVDQNLSYMLLPLIVLGILTVSYVYGRKIRTNVLNQPNI